MLIKGSDDCLVKKDLPCTEEHLKMAWKLFRDLKILESDISQERAVADQLSYRTDSFTNMLYSKSLKKSLQCKSKKDALEWYIPAASSVKSYKYFSNLARSLHPKALEEAQKRLDSSSNFKSIDEVTKNLENRLAVVKRKIEKKKNL